MATLAPFYDLATTSVDLSGTPDGWGIRDVLGVQASVRSRSRERDRDDHAAGRRLGLFRLDGRTDVLRDEQLAEYIRSALLVLEQNWSQVELVNAEGNITTLAQSYLDEASPAVRLCLWVPVFGQ